MAETLDKDLSSIQQARNMVKTAKAAQKKFADFDQLSVDRIIRAMALAGAENAQRLARLAVDETGIGRYEDKIVKNMFASKEVYESIKDLKTVGIIKDDKAKGIIEIASPVGVVMGIIPTTNPTSTAIFKAMIALKARNAIVLSPHPRAVKCTCEAAKVMADAATMAGAPEGLISCLSIPTMEATNELMKSPDVSVILATGGGAMVKAAYSSGKPAYGVGPGNVPAFIERSANIKEAVSNIVKSKTFDNGTICASEQSVIVEECIAREAIAEFIRQGVHFVTGENKKKLQKAVISANGGMNADVVGKSPQEIAVVAGINIPEGTRLLIAPLESVGKTEPLSAEKLCPVLGFYVAVDWMSACELCYELLAYGGMGHSLVIHSENQNVILEFALKKPVFRILCNTPSALGAIGATTNLPPSLTLGCGAVGGNITSDNVGPLHLVNIKRLAFGRR